MRSSISLFLNDQDEAAQLPAYCFIPTKNETYSGLSAPRTIGKSAATNTTAISTGFMSPSAYPLFGWKFANRNPAQKMKNTFHSSGTAIGIVERIKVCSIQIEMIAIHVAHGHGEKSKISGIINSQALPPICAIKWVTVEGRRSLGKSFTVFLRNFLEIIHGVF